jgi:hypothetical protein
VSVSDIYIARIGLPSVARKYADRSWEYIKRSHIHECVGTRNHTIFVHFKYSLYINDTRRIQVD